MDISLHDRIVSLYTAGSYPIAIRAETGVSLTHIYRILRKANVVMRSQAESHRRHQMDFAFFERIDSHEKAQVLGFIYADGCVTDRGTVVVKIAHEDHAYLEYIKRVTRYTGMVRVQPSRRPNEQALSSLLLCSPKMTADLARLGCVPRKSLTVTFPTPDQVPDEFIDSFMLGYFEGDGSITRHQRPNRPNPEFVMTVAGTRAFCMTYAERLAIPQRVIDIPDNRINLLRIDGNRQVRRVMDRLYAHAPYYLPRKRVKYDLLCAQLDALDAKRAPSNPPAAGV